MSSKEKTIGMKEGGKPTLVPKLRFPEFRKSLAWEMKPLSAGLDYLQPTPYLVSDTSYRPIYKTPVLTAGKTFILGYTNEEHGIFRDGLPVIIFDDFTTASQFVDFPFKAKSSAMKILQAKNGSNIKFMFEALQMLSFEVGAHERHWISVFAPMLVAVPKPCEQQKIAECLSSVDEAIAAQARKVDALKKHKKGLMQQLFPQEGETQPHLRFPEFRNDRGWAEVRLDKLGELISGLTYSPDDVRESGLLVLRSSNVQNGRIALGDDVYVDPAIKGANLSQPNDILICVRNGSKALIGKSALIPEGLPLCTHGAFMTVFRAQTPGFVFQLLQTTRYHKQVAGDLGATINSINGSQLLKYKFYIPSLPEQYRIADFLGNLDALLCTETKKLENLARHKRGLMQQLFPSPLEVEA
ncbi:MAG: restriction endonuclease subunit S [Roseomonas sp.]|nr:restriction endonuclease subunit S [Roseomonas sp.]